MADFFLGGARHLSDHVNYSAHPNPADRGPFLNKYGFVTESSGQVRIIIFIVRQVFLRDIIFYLGGTDATLSFFS